MTMTFYVENDKKEKLQTGMRQLDADLRKARDCAFQQHELNFQKALDQAFYFYNIPIDKGKFDVSKDFYLL